MTLWVLQSVLIFSIIIEMRGLCFGFPGRIQNKQNKINRQTNKQKHTFLTQPIFYAAFHRTCYAMRCVGLYFDWQYSKVTLISEQRAPKNFHFLKMIVYLLKSSSPVCVCVFSTPNVNRYVEISKAISLNREMLTVARVWQCATGSIAVPIHLQFSTCFKMLVLYAVSYGIHTLKL